MYQFFAPHYLFCCCRWLRKKNQVPGVGAIVEICPLNQPIDIGIKGTGYSAVDMHSWWDDHFSMPAATPFIFHYSTKLTNTAIMLKCTLTLLHWSHHTHRLSANTELLFSYSICFAICAWFISCHAANWWWWIKFFSHHFSIEGRKKSLSSNCG